ncbi:hypothetical protein [Paenibacillus tianmuensis]|uniref:hypothetical protein n=1 Tax=Paenibacillus tianmuensis TaxID=624147 RepID=UPI001C279B52|nr:hypothetical protein [Paenibacillus tianmuensis]
MSFRRTSVEDAHPPRSSFPCSRPLRSFAFHALSVFKSRVLGADIEATARIARENSIG